MKGYKKYIAQIFFASFLILNISIILVMADPTYFNNFKGSTHAPGCHTTLNTESPNGYVQITSNLGNSVNINQQFNITVQIKLFNEAQSMDVTIGFPSGTPGRGNNSLFSFNVTQYDAIIIDGSGNSANLSFAVTAPSNPGNYTLIADAIEASGPSAIDWATGLLSMEVKTPVNLPQMGNLSVNPNPLELGGSTNVTADIFDLQTSITQVLLEFSGANHTMSLVSGVSYWYSNWTPTSTEKITFKIYAQDTDGNWNYLNGILTVHDTTKPVIKSVIMSVHTIIQDENITLGVDASDLSGIEHVYLNINNQNYSFTYLSINVWQFVWTPEDVGVLFFKIYVIDMNENVATAEETITVNLKPFDWIGFIQNPITIAGLGILTIGVAIALIRFSRLRSKRKKILATEPMVERELLNVKLKEYANNDIIKVCSNCTMCRDECPTYYTREAESFYAGGRLRILRAYTERKLPVDDPFVEAMYFCTGCGQCVDRCPVPVPYVDIIEHLHNILVKSGVGPWGKQKILAQNVQKNKNPYGVDANCRKDWCLDNEKNLMPGVIEVERGPLGYYVGCTASFRTKEAALNTARILSKINGSIVVLGSGEYCCGSPLIRTGLDDFDLKTPEGEIVRFRVKDLVTHNVESLILKDVQEVVYSCAGCYKTSMENWPTYYGKEIPFKRTHITQYLTRLLKEGRIRLKPLNKKITYHDPCHLGRHSKVYDAPREVINSIPNVQFTEMVYNRNRARCCGAGGGVKGGFPQDALKMAKIRLQEAIDTGAEILATSCVFCKYNFLDARKEMGAKIEIVNIEDLAIDLIEVLDPPVPPVDNKIKPSTNETVAKCQ